MSGSANTPKGMMVNQVDAPTVYNVGDPMPKYITGKWANAYIATCTQDIKDRFANMQKRSGIVIPDTDTPLRTLQLELFMSAI